MEALSPLRFVGPSFTTTSLGPNDPKVGDTARIGNEDYLFVYNAGNSAIGQNKAVVLSAVSGYSVTVSSVSSADLLLGVCKHATIATGAYGYIVTKGFANVDLAANVSAAAGTLLELSADGLFAIKSNSTGAAGYSVKAMVAIASAASGTAHIIAG